MAKKKKELSLEEKLEQALVPVEEQPYEVPGNWCWCHVRDIADVVTGSTPSKKNEEYYGGDFPFFKPADLDTGDRVYEATEYLSDEGKDVSRIIPKLSTAVCCIGSIGKSGLLLREGTTNQQINSIIPKINPYYVYYYTKTDSFVSQLWDKSTSTTISMVNKSNTEIVYFPVAPVEEQKRIVEVIESMFAKLDEAKEIAETLIDSVDANIESVLFKALSGELTKKWRNDNGLEMTWDDTYLSKIVSGLKYGSSEKSDYDNNGTPVLRIPNIGDGVIDFDDMKYMSQELENESHEVFPGDILIIRSNGSRDLVGRCALVPELDKRYAYASFLIRMKASERVLPEYLVYFINSSMARGQLFAKAKSSSGIHNINSKELGAISIQVPSVEEQNKIIDIVKPMIEKEKNIKNLLEQTLDNIEELKKSVLAKAFRGELGTNIESEESSIELLKQILEVS